ncbi:hypothetical protein [Polaromonas sp.]|uniref:hypothetical protein n=1 Tax=Polaromonas sp. TaxID=1869339 RepID=UPI001816A74E|nr:hypothetical protein [Polaromonas sp.]NMM05483.1 transposase [Polaromonas sp.]
MNWPLQASAECAAWLRKWLRRFALTRCDWRRNRWTCEQAERLLAGVVKVFGCAQAHHGYLFANARGTRIELLVHDGFGVWCAQSELAIPIRRVKTLRTTKTL